MYTIKCLDRLVWPNSRDPDQTESDPRSSLIRVNTVCHSICMFWIHDSMVQQELQIQNESLAKRLHNLNVSNDSISPNRKNSSFQMVGLTHISLVDPSILINWVSPFLILGVSGALFHFYSLVHFFIFILFRIDIPVSKQ